MNEVKIQKYEQILGRKLDEKEIQRLRQIKDIFEIHENDALWDMIIIMEYYARLCEDIPRKIDEIFSTQSLHENYNDEELIINTKRYAKKHENRIFKGLFGIIFALLLILIGFFLAKFELNLIQIIKLFFASISGLLCLYFSINYIKYVLNSDKKWVTNAGLALLFLVCGLVLLLV